MCAVESNGPIRSRLAGIPRTSERQEGFFAGIEHTIALKKGRETGKKKRAVRPFRLPNG